MTPARDSTIRWSDRILHRKLKSFVRFLRYLWLSYRLNSIQIHSISSVESCWNTLHCRPEEMRLFTSTNCVADERNQTENGQVALRDHRRLLLPRGSDRQAGHEPGDRVKGPKKCSGTGENLLQNGEISLVLFNMHQIPTRLRRPSDFSRTAPNFGCSTPQDRKRTCPNRAVDKPGKHNNSMFFLYEAITDLFHSGLKSAFTKIVCNFVYQSPLSV